MRTLFPLDRPAGQVRDTALSQYLTPEWAARELVAKHLRLTAADYVVEPSCGNGVWLKALPDDVPAIGVELDPSLAAEARHNCNRPVLASDFLVTDFEQQPTVILGNPPYKMELVNGFLSRAHDLLPAGGRVAFLLSVHLLQTPSTVLRWATQFSLAQHLVPRTLFPRAIRPLAFVIMTKDRRRRMVGFSLYREAQAVQTMLPPAKRLAVNGEPGRDCWSSLVRWGLRRLGGRASLSDLYTVVYPDRRLGNRFWREKVRQQVQRIGRRVDRGVWELVT